MIIGWAKFPSLGLPETVNPYLGAHVFRFRNHIDSTPSPASVPPRHTDTVQRKYPSCWVSTGSHV